MVNRVLTSPYLWWFDRFTAGPNQSTPAAFESAGASDMAMTASSGVAQGAGSAHPAGQAERSPFARTTELLAPYQPGVSHLITLSLGEPQHPVPGFVGPVLAKHIAEFGRYPHAPRASSRSGGRSRTGFRPGSDLPRPVDPESEILVLNGSREGLFFAAITAARYVGAAPGQTRDPDARIRSIRPMAPAPAPPVANRSICRPPSPTDSCPTSTRSTTRRWRGRWRSSSPRPANPQGAVASRDYFTAAEAARRPLRLHDPERRVLFGNLHQAGAGQRAGMRRARLHQRGCVPVAVKALEPAGHARRLCRRRQEISRRLSRAAQCRRTPGAGAAAACRGRRL